MLSSIFKPAWQHENAERRLTAVTKLLEQNDRPTAETLQILQTLAEHDVDSAVRTAALNGCSDVGFVLGLCGNGIAEASSRLQVLLSEMTQLTDAEQALLLIESNQSWLVYLLSHCAQSSLREKLLAQIAGNEPLLDEVARASEFSDTRKAAADGITSLLLLEPLHAALRSKDKTLARSVQDRIDELKAIEAEQQRIADETALIIAQMAELADAAWSRQYNAKFYALVNRWQQIESEVSEQQTDAYRAVAIGVEAIVNEHKATLQAIEEQEQMLENARQLAEQLAGADAQELVALVQGAQQLQRSWVDSSAVVVADVAQAEEFAALSSQFNRYDQLVFELTALAATPTEQAQERHQALKQSIGNLAWPETLALPAPLQELQAELATLKEQLANLETQEKAAADSLGKQIGRVKSAVDRGDLKVARGIRRKLDGRIEKVAERFQPRLFEQLVQIDEKIAALADWKAFAAQPKFIELCEQMEALIENPLGELKQAEKIRGLQAQWKALGAASEDTLWQRFQEAGHKAFEPCAAYFDELEKKREQNLQAKTQLVDEMSAWADEPIEDFKVLRNRIRSARDRWRQHADIKPGAAKKLGRKYAQLIKKLEQPLKDEYAKNLLVKQHLVDEAKVIAEQDYSDGARQSMLGLQASWKKAGILDPKKERKLWQDFKVATDAFFAKQREIRDADKENEKALLDQANKIISAIKNLASAARNGELDPAQLQTLVDEYRGLPSLPKQSYARVRSAFEKSLDSVKEGRAHWRKQQESQAYLLADEIAGKLAKFETSAKPPSESQRQAITEQLSEAELPGELQQILEQRLAALDDAEHDEAAISEQRRLICIQIEIAKGVETPAQDAQLRMNYQMRLLTKKGMSGSNTASLSNRLDELRKQWYRLPSAGKEQKELDRRFHELLG